MPDNPPPDVATPAPPQVRVDLEAIAADLEALTATAKQRRIQVCETELLAAVVPILAKHRCTLGTVQQVVNGQPGTVQVVVMALD